MDKWYENLVNFACAMWYGYCIIMFFVVVFQAKEFIDIPIALFACWVMLALPAIIRGKW